MFAGAWLAALVLVALFFDDELDERYQAAYNPNQTPQTSGSLTSGVEVRLKRNRFGHYVTTGTINNQPVTFLLDTGATVVSVPAHIANNLGLIKGQRGQSRTANGVVQVWSTNIDQLAIGNLQMRNVPGSINPGIQDNEVLLGMSALQQVSFQQQGEWLILRSY